MISTRKVENQYQEYKLEQNEIGSTNLSGQVRGADDGGILEELSANSKAVWFHGSKFLEF